MSGAQADTADVTAPAPAAPPAPEQSAAGMQARIAKARSAGYSDQDIGASLRASSQWAPRFDAANKAGYDDDAIFKSFGLSMAPPDTGWADAGWEGLKNAVRGPYQTAQTLAGGKPVPSDPNIAAAQQVQWGDLLHPGLLGKKILYGVASSAPEMVGFTAASVAAGGPETPVGMLAGGVGAAVVHAATTLGPEFGRELHATPNDPDGAFNRAMVSTGVGSLFTGAGFAAFGVKPFVGPLKNIMFQAFGVQPATAVAEVGTKNVIAGKPVTEGMADALPGTMISTAAMLGASKAAEAIPSRARAAPTPTPTPTPGAPPMEGTTTATAPGPRPTGPRPITPEQRAIDEEAEIEAERNATQAPPAPTASPVPPPEVTPPTPPPETTPPAAQGPTRIRTIQQIQDEEGVGPKKAADIQTEEIAARGRPITQEEAEARKAGVAIQGPTAPKGPVEVAPGVTVKLPDVEAPPAPPEESPPVANPVTPDQVQRRDGVGYPEASRRADAENAASTPPETLPPAGQVPASDLHAADYMSRPGALQTQLPAVRSAWDADIARLVQANGRAVVTDLEGNQHVIVGRKNREWVDASGQPVRTYDLLNPDKVGNAPPPAAPDSTAAPPESAPAANPVTPKAEPAATPAPAPHENTPASGAYVMLTPDQLTLDPKRFQYKEADESGVTGALHGISRWESALANPITAWLGLDGKYYVVNGHQRTDLARRAVAAGQADVQVPARLYREADGYTPDYMKALGAYQNIAEGSGTAIDAAKILRAKDSIPAGMQLPTLPPKSALVIQARGLAALSDEAFGAVINGVVAPEHAAFVGEMIRDPAQQMAAIEVLNRAKPSNAAQARFIVKDVLDSGFLTGDQESLFGNEAFAKSLVPERAKIIDAAQAAVRRAKAIFGAAVKGDDTLTAAGNKLTTEGNIKARSDNERILDYLGREATVRGPLSDRLSAAARELADGQPIAGVVARFLVDARKLERDGPREGLPPGDHPGGDGHEGGSEAPEGQGGFLDESPRPLGEFEKRRAPGEPRFDWTLQPGRTYQEIIGETVVEYRGNADGSVELERLDTFDENRRQGSARAAVEAFLKEADERGKTVRLQSIPQEPGVNPRRLDAFYRSLGFKRVTRGLPIMEREPQGAALAAPRIVAPGQDDIFGGTAPARPGRPTAEPTIRNDPRQDTMPGMGPSAKQAQAAGDQSGSGRLRPTTDQRPPNEGLFARKEPDQPGLPMQTRPTPAPERVGREPWGSSPKAGWRDETLHVPFPHGGTTAAIDFVRDFGTRDGNEHLAVVDTHTGEIVHATTDGVVDSVNFNRVVHPGDQQRYTMVHNHPSSTSLSGADVGMLSHPVVKRITAVAHEGGFIDSVTLPDGVHTANFHLLKMKYEAKWQSYLRTMQEMFRDGLLVKEDAIHLADIIMRALHVEGVVRYSTNRPLDHAALRAAFPHIARYDAETGIRTVHRPAESVRSEGGAGSVRPEVVDRPGSQRPERPVGTSDGAPKYDAGPRRGPAQGRLLSGPEDAEGGAAALRERGEASAVEGRLEARRPANLNVNQRQSRTEEPIAAERGLRRIKSEIQVAFSPTSRLGARPMEDMLRRKNAREAQASDQAYHALDSVRQAVDRQSEADQLASAHAYETGQRQATPELQAAADGLRAVVDQWTAKIQGLGKGYLQNAIDNYMGHIWSNYEEWSTGQAAIEQHGNGSRRPLVGSGNFLKKRSFPTQQEGMNAGLIPKTTNWIDQQILKVHEMQKFYYGTQLADQMKQTGIARWIPASVDAEMAAQRDGMVKLDDKIFQPKRRADEVFGRIDSGSYYAKEAAARVFNNYMSAGLSGSTIYRSVRAMNNALNMAQLSLSGFHAAFVLGDMAISKFSLGLQQAARGEVARGAGTMAMGATAIPAWAGTLKRGVDIRKAWLDPTNASPEMQQIVKGLIAGGGRVAMSRIFQTSASGAFFRSMADLKNPASVLWQAKQMFKDAHGIYDHAMLPLRLVGRTLDTMQQPLMGWLVPRAKLGAFADLAEDWYRRNPTGSAEEESAAMRQFVDTIDNRLGQLNYDNLFWNKVTKDIAFATTRSVGWNLGTFRELGGGVVDTVQAARQLARGNKAEFTTRMAYTIALPIITAEIGAVMTYMLTGKPPEHGPDDVAGSIPLDYFYPRTGKIDEASGNASRISIPGYMKDVIAFQRAPVQTVLNKMAPASSLASQVYQNKDYYGGIIYDPAHDSRVRAYSDFLLNQFVPFSVRAWQKMGASGADRMDTALSFFGFQPAPQSIVNPERGEAFEARDAGRGYKQRIRQTIKGNRMDFFNAPSP